MTVEEYIQHELQAEVRHEYINGQLFEMPGEKDINNEMAGTFYLLFLQLLRPKGYQVYNHDVKVAIPGGERYYYPDVFATAEPKTDANKYIKSQPALIVEVVSESTQTQDYVNKYLDYIQIPSLKYYLITEPETLLITVYERGEGEDWVARKFTRRDEVITLPALQIELPMQEIYP